MRQRDYHTVAGKEFHVPYETNIPTTEHERRASEAAARSNNSAFLLANAKGKKITALGLSKVPSVSTISPRVTPRDVSKNDSMLLYREQLRKDREEVLPQTRKPYQRREPDLENKPGLNVGDYKDSKQLRQLEKDKQAAYRAQLLADKNLQPIPQLKVPDVQRSTEPFYDESPRRLISENFDEKRKAELARRAKEKELSTRGELLNSPRCQGLSYFGERGKHIALMESADPMKIGIEPAQLQARIKESKERNMKDYLAYMHEADAAKASRRVPEYEIRDVESDNFVNKTGWTSLNVGGCASGNTRSQAVLEKQHSNMRLYKNVLDQQREVRDGINKEKEDKVWYPPLNERREEILY